MQECITTIKKEENVSDWDSVIESDFGEIGRQYGFRFFISPQRDILVHKWIVHNPFFDEAILTIFRSEDFKKQEKPMGGIISFSKALTNLNSSINIRDQIEKQNKQKKREQEEELFNMLEEEE